VKPPIVSSANPSVDTNSVFLKNLLDTKVMPCKNIYFNAKIISEVVFFVFKNVNFNIEIPYRIATNND